MLIASHLQSIVPPTIAVFLQCRNWSVYFSIFFNLFLWWACTILPLHRICNGLFEMFILDRSSHYGHSCIPGLSKWTRSWTVHERRSWKKKPGWFMNGFRTDDCSWTVRERFMNVHEQTTFMNGSWTGSWTGSGPGRSSLDSWFWFLHACEDSLKKSAGVVVVVERA